MLRIYHVLLFVSLFLFTACGSQPYANQESAFIVLKTPTMRYADMGFVYENPQEVKVEIYGSGQALFSLMITPNSVCSGRFACMSRSQFNRQMLSAVYPDNTIEQIFRGKPLFNGQNLYKKRNGFTQKFVKPGSYDIHYSVLKNETVFRDTINHIVIKIKQLRG